MNGQPHVPADFPSGRKTPLPTELEGEWAPDSGVDSFGEEKILAFAGIQTLNCPNSSLIIIRLCPHKVPRYDGRGQVFYTCS
jgi:hypothetical protein